MNAYDLDAHIAEYYDQNQAFSEDVDLIRRLIGGRQGLRILEPFCGTGRILIPLAQEGHTLVGMDLAQGMLRRAQAKIDQLPSEVQDRITLIQADVTHSDWPEGFDLAILGGNCFYELATPAQQEGCIRQAAACLFPGGSIYIDNDHMEGDLDASWQKPVARLAFPTGLCADGSRLESKMQTIRCDVSRRLAWLRRYTRITLPDGRVIDKDYIQLKHPVSAVEVRAWLKKHGFTIQHCFGDRAGSPYSNLAERAIFWACKSKIK